MRNHFQEIGVEVHFAMASMKSSSCLRVIALFTGALVTLLPARLDAQSAGGVDFVALVAPTGGQPEPVRQLRFYLLRKSLEDIRAEAASQSAAGADLDKFIDGLSVSPELKAWMTKHHTVRLSGEDFTKGLTAKDIVQVPEFFQAYMTHNEAFRGVGFPEPKFKQKDAVSNPEKYKPQKDAYEAAVRKFIASNPDTIAGMDLELLDLNPYTKWLALEGKQQDLLDARTFRVAEERYVAAHTNTDLDGHGSFSGIAPGHYWIGLLGTEAISGAVRVRWDFPVTVRQGETARIELSNLNAVRVNTSAQNSEN
jgi:hypothetical protein